MFGESRVEHRATALFIGDLPSYRQALIQPAETAGWHFEHAPDVYAGLAWLLRAADRKPAAVLVAGEALSGDELRFFNVVARRWPSLPVAVCYDGDPEDRRLEACRRRGLAVLAASAVLGWLSDCVRPEPQAAPESIEPDVSEPDVPGDRAEDREVRQEPLATTESQRQGPASQVSLSEQLHLTPWSRVSRAMPRRKPPNARASTGTGSPPVQASDESSPENRKPKAVPDKALLTPEELKALLGDADELPEAQEDVP